MKSKTGPPTKRRKLNVSAVEEVVFDQTSRFDYLTGFHKRKVQRTKAAQEAAAQRARQERIDDRKKLREERKADLERHVREVNAMLPSANIATNAVSDQEEVEEACEVWSGIQDAIPEPVDHEAEYIDEDKYTTVTVEEVDISRDGISKLKDGTGEEVEEGDKTSTSGCASTSRQKPSTTRIKDKDKRPKRKKKAFRYESPAERKANRLKDKAKKSKQAQMRRGD
ncbi:hypothetical protein LTR05_006571 [Lithohypha guttulata]|uniref:Nucleolar protein 12 n=1 Tax=Lithohypha guttulata TaxID=1690604 RepID=A0AAN7SWJ3_9EURO|nr:hypothetical protein LTR05_006571 [Lithohypha guttulata]